MPDTPVLPVSASDSGPPNLSSPLQSIDPFFANKKVLVSNMMVDLKVEVGILNNSMQEVRQKIVDNSKDIAGLKEDNISLKADIKALDSKIDTVKTEIDTVKTEIAAFKTEFKTEIALLKTGIVNTNNMIKLTVGILSSFLIAIGVRIYFF
jgi:seryl-tRNA synthetase